MTRLLVVMLAIALLFDAVPAVAKEKVDPRIEAAIACANLDQSDKRLHCFDQAIAGLKQALTSGQLVPAGESNKPLALEGKVLAAGHFGFNRFWLELESGDRWELQASNRFDDVPPKQGNDVTIKRAAIGGYWVKEIGGPTRRANYLGRRSN